MATVKHVVFADGTHAIGVGDGTSFVPFVRLDADRYAALEENEHLAEPKKKGDKDKDGGA